jgi:hypothetical protein
MLGVSGNFFNYFYQKSTKLYNIHEKLLITELDPMGPFVLHALSLTFAGYMNQQEINFIHNFCAGCCQTQNTIDNFS